MQMWLSTTAHLPPTEVTPGWIKEVAFEKVIKQLPLLSIPPSEEAQMGLAVLLPTTAQPFHQTQANVVRSHVGLSGGAGVEG